MRWFIWGHITNHFFQLYSPFFYHPSLYTLTHPKTSKKTNKIDNPPPVPFNSVLSFRFHGCTANVESLIININKYFTHVLRRVHTLATTLTTPLGAGLRPLRAAATRPRGPPQRVGEAPIQKIETETQRAQRTGLRPGAAQRPQGHRQSQQVQTNEIGTRIGEGAADAGHRVPAARVPPQRNRKDPLA